eukprot:UN00933
MINNVITISNNIIHQIVYIIWNHKSRKDCYYYLNFSFVVFFVSLEKKNCCFASCCCCCCFLTAERQLNVLIAFFKCIRCRKH